MFAGSYQLGGLVPLRLWCLTSGAIPTEPDASPLAVLYDSNGAIALALRLPIDDRHRVTGYFRHLVSLDSRFSTGRYSVHYTYEIADTVYGAAEEFEVLAGGDPTGAGIAMHFFRQPSSDFVLYQTDNGSLVKLRNPQVRSL